jgi:cysteinyl-tRNA synthetase
MKLYNTLSRSVEEFQPLEGGKVSMYSCGPTVYDHIHIGNLSAFIYADTLRRVLSANGLDVKHVMNYTDVDDKTIRRSRERYPDDSAEVGLQKLTDEYKQVFLEDMRAIGNDVDAIQFTSAVDSIQGMRDLITELHQQGFAYITDDGVYFSIQKYRDSGKKYGQLLELTEANTSDARIDNDEYDKESVHDFALWKTRKDGEPAWEFELDGHDLLGRPGWHIECSVMSASALGQPFDIHTGGVDLVFPHHENEIAQSTAGHDDPTYAKCFVHNEHLLVDGKKMSKSLGNFFTLRDIREKGIDPMAFRLMVLQSHYRSQSNFTWESLHAAQNRLKAYRAMADLRWQIVEHNSEMPPLAAHLETLTEIMADDLNSPQALAKLSNIEAVLSGLLINTASEPSFSDFLSGLDALLGLKLSEQWDVTDAIKTILNERVKARKDNDWAKSDELRDQLQGKGIGVRDTAHGQIWYRF